MSTNYISQITATDGVTYDVQEGVTTRIFRATCSTANATAAKVATLDDSTGYSLAAGVRVAVTFTYGNTATSPTLNVNSGGAKYIYYRTDISSAQKVDELCVWGANETVIFTYNGSSWIMMGSSLALYNAYNKAASSGSGTITEVKTNEGAHTTIDVLSGKAEFNVPTTAAHVGAATSDHTHGNITNGGDITATAPTIANGDQIIINDNSASKITNGPTFDGSTTTKALTQKGTWETFSKFSGSYNDLSDKPTIPTNTWRSIQLNGTQILAGTAGTNALNLKAGTNISLSNSSGTVTINGPDLSNYLEKTYSNSGYTGSISWYTDEFGGGAGLTSSMTDGTNISEFYMANSGVAFSYNGASHSGTIGVSSAGIDIVADSVSITGVVTPVYDNSAANKKYVDDSIGALTIPTETTVSGWGFTKNTGTLTGVTFAGTAMTVSNGVASITQTNARTALGLATVATSGSYNDLSNKPTIPANTDEKVKLTSNTGSTAVPLVLGPTSITSGTAYNCLYNTNLKYTPSTGNLQTTQINGVTVGSSPKFTDTNTISAWYGTCSSNSTTETKIVSCSGFTLSTGALIAVHFSSGNQLGGAIKLNVNSTGDKPIYYKGAAVSTSNMLYWQNDENILFSYDGTNYQYVSNSFVVNEIGSSTSVSILLSTDAGNKYKSSNLSFSSGASSNSPQLIIGDSSTSTGILTLGNNGKQISITPITLSASRTITLPDKTGTVALTSDIPTVPTITLNGSSTTSPSFYAPTSAGTSGYYLKSNGSGAPTWAAFPTVPTITLNGSSTTSPSFYAPTSAGTSGKFLKSSGSGAPSWSSITQTNINASSSSLEFEFTGDTYTTNNLDDETDALYTEIVATQTSMENITTIVNSKPNITITRW